jgi:hypothetical protein
MEDGAMRVMPMALLVAVVALAGCTPLVDLPAPPDAHGKR